MADTAWVNDTLTLGSQEILIQNGSLPIHDLSFYSENPRIYSLIQRPGFEPSQEEIYDRLRRLDHVKQLIQAIRANGGLTDPMLVRDGDFVVLEGNSRVAAYREIAKNDAITWGKAKVSDCFPQTSARSWYSLCSASTTSSAEGTGLPTNKRAICTAGMSPMGSAPRVWQARWDWR